MGNRIYLNRILLIAVLLILTFNVMLRRDPPAAFDRGPSELEYFSAVHREAIYLPPEEDDEADGAPDPIAVNINKAGAEMLVLLPGIGDILAERIIEYREENGDFASPEEIMEVKGIGEATFEKIRDFIRVE